VWGVAFSVGAGLPAMAAMTGVVQKIMLGVADFHSHPAKH
jgi:hypothetical protein